jgi:type II secretory pathway pseudopilin PulG
VTLIELMVVVGIVGVLTGLALPAVVGVRQTSITNQAMTDLRAVDVAVNANCGKGKCDDFRGPARASVQRAVPAPLVDFLPSGFVFKSDSNSYALELETWMFDAGPDPRYPLCLAACMAAIQTPTWANDSLGFSNGIGFKTPKTIYVNINIVTANGDVAQSLYARAGGSPPVFISSRNVWKYVYPVLVGIPATG